MEGRIIKDQFLWEASNTDSYTMRQFGLQVLSEQLGRTAYARLWQDTKRRFSEAFTEIISYNINMYNKLKMGQYLGPIGNVCSPDKLDNKDSLEKSCFKQELVNPIVKVNLRLHKIDGELIEDSLYWDLEWRLNQPEEFAKDYWWDLELSSNHIKQVSFAIRKQIFDHLKQISLNKKYDLLKLIGIPAAKHVKKMASRSWNKKYNRDKIEKSEFGDNEMYIPK